MLFLDEIENILESMEVVDFDRIYELLFKRLAGAIMSPHFQVTDDRERDDLGCIHLF